MNCGLLLTFLLSHSGTLRPGRLTLLLGPPSSGKSTLLKALSDKLGNSGLEVRPDPNPKSNSNPDHPDPKPRIRNFVSASKQNLRAALALPGQITTFPWRVPFSAGCARRSRVLATGMPHGADES